MDIAYKLSKGDPIAKEDHLETIHGEDLVNYVASVYCGWRYKNYCHQGALDEVLDRWFWASVEDSISVLEGVVKGLKQIEKEKEKWELRK